MKKQIIDIFKLLYIINIMILLCIFPNCKNKKTEISASEKKRQEYALDKIKQDIRTGKEYNHYTPVNMNPPRYYSPLTYNKFQSIIANQDQFSKIRIIYGTDDYDESDQTGVMRTIIMGVGSFHETILFSDVAAFQCKYDMHDNTVNPPVSVYLDHDFTKELVVQTIISYLDSNKEYFFNNQEFSDLPIPYESNNYSVQEDRDKGFQFEIYEPESNSNAWVIDKESDNPDPILQGLLDIMETHFMSVFED
jgi:hypothetical protein